MTEPLEPISVAEVEAEDEPELLDTQQVANLFKVSTKTVSRWSQPGAGFEQRNVKVLTTFGGHRRYYKDEIYELFGLMLEDKLYEDVTYDDGKTTGPRRIVGVSQSRKGDPRLK